MLLGHYKGGKLKFTGASCRGLQAYGAVSFSPNIETAVDTLLSAQT